MALRVFANSGMRCAAPHVMAAITSATRTAASHSRTGHTRAGDSQATSSSTHTSSVHAGALQGRQAVVVCNCDQRDSLLDIVVKPIVKPMYWLTLGGIAVTRYTVEALRARIAQNQAYSETITTQDHYRGLTGQQIVELRERANINRILGVSLVGIAVVTGAIMKSQADKTQKERQKEFEARDRFDARKRAIIEEYSRNDRPVSEAIDAIKALERQNGQGLTRLGKA